jgi:GAF domain-containing protein
MSHSSESEEALAAQLRALIRALGLSQRALLPSSNQALLQSIVDAAAQIFGSAAASIALVDPATDELVFRVAHGVGQENLIGMRIPVDAGIAGYVAMTGQPLAIADVEADPRFDVDFATTTGYVPRSILAVPLVLEERVIGVMEVLDKLDAATYGLQDMELLGLFARQAAIAIDQSQQYEALDKVFVKGIRALVSAQPTMETGEIEAAIADLDFDQTRQHELTDLVDTIRAISQSGEAERALCMDVLAILRAYLKSKPDVF